MSQPQPPAAGKAFRAGSDPEAVSDTAFVLVSSASCSEKSSLSQQYGGHHSNAWVDLFPPSWVPYIQLSRLSPPVAPLLVFLPHLFGALYAAVTHNLPFPNLLSATGLLLLGSILFSNAAHAWNDLIDASIDARIERTKKRPIPRGAISHQAAVLFALSQVVCAGTCLLFFPRDARLAAIATIIGTVYYPFAKRHTNFAQFVLGFCIAWGAVVGSAAAGTSAPWEDKGTLALVIAMGLWVVVFDVVYAHQDLRDDLRVGVKSMAVLLSRGPAERARGFLGGMCVLMNAALVASGWYGEFGVMYHVVTVGGGIVSVGGMVAVVDLSDAANCWFWFSKGFWATGAAIAGGLGMEYVLRAGGS